MNSDLHLHLRERDLAEDQERLTTEEQKAIFRMGWHAGFASGMEVARDVVGKAFKEDRDERPNISPK